MLFGCYLGAIPLAGQETMADLSIMKFQKWLLLGKCLLVLYCEILEFHRVVKQRHIVKHVKILHWAWSLLLCGINYMLNWVMLHCCANKLPNSKILLKTIILD